MYNYFLHLRTSLIIKKKEFLNRILSKNHHYTPFVILCEPRTGSTLLHTYLNFHPNIKSYGEVIREQIEKGHNNDTLNLKANIFKPHGNHLKAIGLKLFYFYYDHPSYANIFKEIVDQKEIKIIHLVRKDIFKLYVSLKMAQKTNIWSSLKTNTKIKHKVLVKPNDFKPFAETYLQRQHYFKMLFKHHEVLLLTYEDLTDHAETALEKVQNFLEINPITLSSLLKKQNTDPLSSVVINYEEVYKSIIHILKEVAPAENT